LVELKQSFIFTNKNFIVAKKEKEKKELKHVAVAGNIGSGKTTLTELLAKHYNWEPRFEDVENNPYLNDFYTDMPRWSFNLQVYFLNNRLQQLVEIQSGDRVVVQDRTIYEDAHIFAPNLHEMGLMSTRDFENYISLFRTIRKQITPPNLLIYLKASLGTLVGQIEKRGRAYEDNIRLDYLKQLNQYYENWIENYKEGPLLVITVDDLNFAEKPEDLGKVIEKVNAELFGLF
jgi:deoxyadenosine/deoxycytidine kinase